MQPFFTAPKSGPGPAAGDVVKDATTATFMTDVVEASNAVPVIVDFWATWCGPCKTLGPMIEKAVRAANGAVRLVKIDVDRNPELAQQMRIQSIPAVYAFFQGRPVDGFVGALPESQIKQFVDRLSRLAGAQAGPGGPAPEDLEAALAEAREALNTGDVDLAQDIFGQIVEIDPSNAAAFAGLVRCLIARRDLGRARQMLDSAPAEIRGSKDVAAARSALEIVEESRTAAPHHELAQRLDRNPDDHEARYELAMSLFAEGKYQAAVDELLEIVRRDREWNDQAARKQLVKLFDVIGPTDKLTVTARRRLSSMLFS